MMLKHDVISLNRVRDTIRFREGSETLTLKVDGDALKMTVGIGQAVKMLQGINEETPEEERKKVAQFFAEVLFGKEQAAKLSEFYLNDEACLINVCSKAFADKISKDIDKVQKKAARK